MSKPPADQNRWLVEEMYEQFQEDRSQLSSGWQEFFEDYRPPPSTGERAGSATAVPDELDVTPPPDASVTEAKAPGEQAKAPAKPTSDTPAASEAGPEPKRMRGVAATIARNMDESLEVPTATSVRDVPAKLLEVNRRIINNHLGRRFGGKVSFTHLIAYAILKAANDVPGMKRVYRVIEDKPHVLENETVGLGIAVDMQKDDGSRTLMVPCIRDADTMTFAEFHEAYEEIIRKIRRNKLDPEMFAGVTLSITNPGMIGTVHSIPRLMNGQAAIVGVGSIAYPPEYEAADPKMLARLGVSKRITLTSTYDHRVIQGAESGEFLKRIHEYLVGKHDFYEEVFRSIGVPYTPAEWRQDVSPIDSELAAMEKQKQVDALIHMHRVRGHLIADLDPLSAKDPSLHPELDPVYYGLSIWDLDREFLVDDMGGERKLPLGKILSWLRDAYCRTVGVEYMHIQSPEEKDWLRLQLEGVDTTMAPEDQLYILQRLSDAEAFERFLHTKYVGQKRFGLEGGESLIPLLDAVAESAADDALEGIVFGMAHRGRLNVLVNIMGKQYNSVFREFEGDIDPDTVQGSGDVKYHLGVTGQFTSRAGNTVEIRMPPNPSHLEAVDPVVEGMVRAWQDELDRGEEFPVMPVLMHGDAAFSGQGVVAETLNMSQLRGYRTGGTIHVVINNQVGFTASPESSRSSHYATDVARMVQAPILHVNGDDPEAVVRVARLAYDYRRTFNKDVVIDLICYRRHGHNEADDPSFTQPLMYKVIEEKRSPRKLYTERLVKRGDITLEQAEEAMVAFERKLETAFDETKQSVKEEKPKAAKPQIHGVLAHVDTGVSKDILDKVAGAHFSVPEWFTPHPKLRRIFERSKDRYDKGEIDWALGETLAYGSLLMEGTTVRLSGQDSRRGTFSQRHAVQVDYRTGEDYLPLAELSDDQGKWFIYDSLLSEYAALGFEYGYSVVAKDALVAWEAQFGDFVNGAQIVIDQFIVAAEDKWKETSGLVMLLPHGYEGQGPEHSSARIERFLTLCAEDNIQVVNATTAAQYFHVLRRQVRRDVRKPLVIFTPKSLLRSKDAYSDIEELTAGHFRETVDDPFIADKSSITTVALCSGKVAYDAMSERGSRAAPVAVVRVEQLYPWPEEQVRDILHSYPNAKDIVWLQEEPRNMGPWGFVDGRLWNILDDLNPDEGHAHGPDKRRLRCVSRIESASPATGSHVVHEQEFDQLMTDLFEGGPEG